MYIELTVVSINSCLSVFIEAVMSIADIVINMLDTILPVLNSMSSVNRGHPKLSETTMVR